MSPDQGNNRKFALEISGLKRTLQVHEANAANRSTGGRGPERATPGEGEFPKIQKELARLTNVNLKGVPR